MASGMSLWQEAANQLSEEDRQNFNVTGSGGLDISGLLTTVEAKKQECINKRWKYKKGNREIIIRDQLEKIIVWVNKFKEVGDIAVQYDPGQAALPWACVRFILQATINDSQIFGAMVEGMESVSKVITKYAITEKLYLQQRSNSIETEFKQSLVKLYTSVLVYLSSAKRYYSQNSAVRIAKSVISTKESSVKKYLSKISGEGANADKYTRLISREGSSLIPKFNASSDIELQADLLVGEDVAALKLILEQLEYPINRSAAQLSDLHDSLKNNERAEMFRWLSTIPHRSHHENIGNEFLPQSGQWLQQKSEFADWRRSSVSSILWLHGIPGSGKSKIVYSVIEHLNQEGSTLSAPAPVAYFYCIRNEAEPARADPTEILRSILKQLSSSKINLSVRMPLVDDFKRKKEAANNDGSDPSKLNIGDCVKFILVILEHDPATIIIDALDECNPSRRGELLEALDEIILKSASLVKVFVSSRDNGDILARLTHSPNIYISIEDNRGDIKRFIESRVLLSIKRRKLLNGHVSIELKDKIISDLEQGANGMFRWVDLQIQNLCDPDRIKHESDVYLELGRLPESLKSLYDIVFEKLMRSAFASRVTAQKTMKWLLGAKRPLNTQELIAAISVGSKGCTMDISTGQLLDMCCNLIVLDAELDMFRFAHLSVREYLEESRPEFTELEINQLLTERCIDSYLLISQSKQLSMGNNTALKHIRTLEPYATQYWPVHYQSIERKELHHQLKEKVRDFLFYNGQATESFAYWIQKLDKLTWFEGKNVSSSPPTPFFLACCYGLITLLEELSTSRSFDCYQKNYKGISGYFLAVAYGCEAVVQLLLEKGADIGALDKDGNSALKISINYRNNAVVRLLLENGADTKVPDRYSRTPLHWAAKIGNNASVQLLLENGAVTEILDWVGRTALHLAAERGENATVQLLLEKGANIAAVNKEGETALHLAAKLGENATVQLLLEKGANIAAVKKEGETALHLAAKLGENATVQLLLEKGADIAAVSKVGWTALHLAAQRWDNATVQLLLEKGADIAAVSKGGWTALHLAAQRWDNATVKPLLEKGADVAAVNEEGKTALHLAAELRNNALVQLLLEKGADVAAVSKKGETALHLAAKSGDNATVQLLLENGADFAVLDQNGRTPLHFAAERSGNAAMVQLLMENGGGPTTLNPAAEAGYEDTV
ncbi:MAG: hypothetical protein M1829_000950 [Trizodia sp. TS-e1964]|nr:MAG: hypothetical protein M1829_000950 [Trizodia sp. TS-e1964]